MIIYSIQSWAIKLPYFQIHTFSILFSVSIDSPCFFGQSLNKINKDASEAAIMSQTNKYMG